MDVPLKNHIDSQFMEVNRRLDEISGSMFEEARQGRDDRKDIYTRLNKVEIGLESRPTYKEMLAATAAVAALLISLFELIF